MSETAASPAIDPVIIGEHLDDAHAAIDLLVPADLLYFRGHFPAFPVLPGIVQTHWAVMLGRRCFGLGPVPVVSVQVKFKRVIAPRDKIRLELAFVRDRRRLTFEYRDAQSVRSSGALTFGDAG